MAMYGKAEYWDERYKATECQGPYEWYQPYHCLRHLLSADALAAATKLDSRIQFPSHDKCRILMLGCGNSSFGEDMKRDGWTGPMTSMDFSSVVIEQLKARYSEMGVASDCWSETTHFVCTDVTKGIPLKDKSVDLIVCKGTLDSILCSAGSSANARKVIQECHRVLADDHGVLFLVSHGNPDSRVVFLEHENDLSFYWKEVSVHKLNRPDDANRSDYVYICRKQEVHVTKDKAATVATVAAATDDSSNTSSGSGSSSNSNHSRKEHVHAIVDAPSKQ